MDQVLDAFRKDPGSQWLSYQICERKIQVWKKQLGLMEAVREVDSDDEEGEDLQFRDGDGEGIFEDEF